MAQNLHRSFRYSPAEVREPVRTDSSLMRFLATALPVANILLVASTQIKRSHRPPVTIGNASELGCKLSFLLPQIAAVPLLLGGILSSIGNVNHVYSSACDSASAHIGF